MYQFLDRRLDDLASPAAFILRAMRMWVASVQDGRCPCRMTSRHFANARMEPVAGDFGMAMFTLNGDGLQQLHLAPPGCLSVRDDEARLLSLFERALERDQSALNQLAATLVDEAAIPRLVQAVSCVATRAAMSHPSTRLD